MTLTLQKFKWLDLLVCVYVMCVCGGGESGGGGGGVCAGGGCGCGGGGGGAPPPPPPPPPKKKKSDKEIMTRAKQTRISVSETLAISGISFFVFRAKQRGKFQTREQVLYTHIQALPLHYRAPFVK